MLVGTRADAGRASAALAARDLRRRQAGQVGQPPGVERDAAGWKRGSQGCALTLPLPQGLELSPIFFNLPPPRSPPTFRHRVLSPEEWRGTGRRKA